MFHLTIERPVKSFTDMFCPYFYPVKKSVHADSLLLSCLLSALFVLEIFFDITEWGRGKVSQHQDIYMITELIIIM